MMIFLIVILLLAALLEFFSLRGGTSCVDADISLSPVRTEADAPIELTALVSNKSRLPITYLTLRLAFPLSAVFPEGVAAAHDQRLCFVTEVFRLWVRRSVARSIRFSMTRRGVFTISAKQLGRGDFLGLRVSTAHLDIHRSVIVFPRRLDDPALTEALGRALGELPAERWLLRDPVLTLGVREYTGYEPMHTISWAQTARRGELTVREFDYTRTQNCCVLFCISGLSHSETELLDLCCSAARTVCETLIGNGFTAELFTNSALNGYPSAPCRHASASAGREEEVLEILARATTIPCVGAEEFAKAALELSPDAAAYLFLIPRDTPEAEAAVEYLRRMTGADPHVMRVESLEVGRHD